MKYLKRIILGMVFLLGMTSTINAEEEEYYLDSYQACLNAGWDFGTVLDGAEGQDAWFWTGFYIDTFCN